tara:strand:- start:982 stop:1392 length:411 start_codon:yes stop_codon:yes gene_type:complete
MATYHPPKIITTQASPAITADLTYEGHGKCGQTRILRSGGNPEDAIFDAQAEGKGNAWKMVVISMGTYPSNPDCRCDYTGQIKKFQANNIEPQDCDKLTQVALFQNFEIMADITLVVLSSKARDMIVVLYMDCEQS